MIVTPLNLLNAVNVLADLLGEARDVIALDIAVFLECGCQLDPTSGEPIRSTLDAETVPHVTALEGLVKRMDAVLEGLK